MSRSTPPTTTTTTAPCRPDPPPSILTYANAAGPFMLLVALWQGEGAAAAALSGSCMHLSKLTLGWLPDLLLSPLSFCVFPPRRFVGLLWRLFWRLFSQQVADGFNALGWRFPH